MSRIDDDNVEDFFKNADASRFETEYNEKDWEKMALRLDQEEERMALLKRRKAGRYVLLTAALLLLIATTVYLFNAGNTSNEVSSPANDLQKTDSPVRDNDQPLQDDIPISDGVIENPQSSEGITKDTGIALPSAEAEPTFKNQSESAVQPIEKNSGDKLFSQQATTSPSSGVKTQEESNVSENDYGKNQNLISEDIVRPDELLSGTGEIVEQLDKDTNALSLNEGITTQKEVSADSLKEVKPDSTVQIEDLAFVKKKDKREKDLQPLASRWMISFSMAPDFSKTPESTFDVPVSSIGVNVSYQLTPRWNISTGITRVSKQYWGYGDEYKPPYGYWSYVTNGVVPEKVEGNCLVLEIPLSLAYNVVETKRGRLFVSVGVSSYLMRSEKYVYTFEDPNPGAASGWSTKEPSSYWFDIGSLSVGYDFRVSPAVSLGVEPYYKIPFSGMGWADIDMYSTGILFSARYRFLKREQLHRPSDAIK